MEFIRVSKDGWNFEGENSGKRFIPFGANLIFHYPRQEQGRSLSILTQEEWDPETIRRVFEGARSVNMNLMKVFLPSTQTIPDPQTNERFAFAEMTPPLLERLHCLFEIARDTGVYVSLSFAEWGMRVQKWFHEGGIFMGRHQNDGPGVDSFAVFRNFWRALAEHCRDESALFSYNLAVELFIPSGNWGAFLDEDHRCLFSERWGLPAWRRWLAAKYGGASGANEAWGTSYQSMDEIPQPEIKWVGEDSAYTMPQAMIADYNSFKGYVTYCFLKNQVDAIRSVDTRHMVTAGLHPNQSGIDPAGHAASTAGMVQSELDFLDYLTTHLYTQFDYLITRPGAIDDRRKTGADAATLERRRREAVLYARFIANGKPIIAEEMGHLVRDHDESLEGSLALAEALAGHVSGFQLWVLGDVPPEAFGPLGEDLTANDWGRAWRKLAEPGGAVAELPRERAGAKSTVRLERTEGLAPVRETEGEKLIRNWDEAKQPVDFDWPPNPTIEKVRKAGA